MYNFFIESLKANIENIKGSVFCLSGTTLASMMDWIPVTTIRDAAVVTIVSAVLGFYANKALKAFDDWVKRKRRKRKPKA